MKILSRWQHSGKAMGTFGAFVTGRKEIMDIILNRARPFIFTTALPPSVCASSMAAFDVLENEPERREALWKRVSFFRDGLKKAGFNTLESDSHIIPIVVGESRRTMELSEDLLKEGVFIQGIRLRQCRKEQAGSEQRLCQRIPLRIWNTLCLF